MIKRLLWPTGKTATRATVNVYDVLRSGENGLSSHQYARMTNNLLRPSTRFVNGPHVEFLEEFDRVGDAIFEDVHFFQTNYFKNAAECISFTGRYFEAKADSQIRDVARNFVAAHKGVRPDAHKLEHGHNAPDDPIVVAKVAESKCWTLVSGNHRLASRWVKGERTAKVEIMEEVVRTPLQDMLRDVHWQKNRTELYQPIPYPEVQDWPLVRKCSDRGALIIKYLENSNHRTAVDIGCSYGWFVRLLTQRGYDTYGIDRDLFALKIAELVYGVKSNTLIRDDILHFLANQRVPYDVVTCFSVIHHFALGLGAIGPEEFVSMLDRVTGSVLFFDTGQSHEAWFKNSLRVWDTAYIIEFIKKYTTFTKIDVLGVDTDNVGPYADNYARTLFACSR